MDMMNRTFHDYLDRFIMVLIDDILIYSKTWEEHLQKDMERLRREQIYAKLKKCEFWLNSVSCIGHMISGEAIAID